MSQPKNPDSHSGRQPNRLINEQSPYLRQHAYNPVDWYAWGPDALERARVENKADHALDWLLGLPLVPRDGSASRSRTTRSLG